MLGKRAIGLALVAVFVGTALAGCLNSNTNNGTPTSKGTLKFGTEAAYPPFEDTTGGAIVGFDVDVIKAIGNLSGYTIELTNAQFSAIIPSIVSGQFDGGVSAFTITDERKQQVDFTVPYYDNELLVAVKGGDSTIKDEASLKAAISSGKKLCTQTGTTSEDYARTHLGADNSTLDLLDAFPPCADALKRGDVVAMMIDRATVRVLIDQSGGALAQAFTIPVDEHFGIAISKTKKDVLTAFNEALTKMKGDGSLRKLQDKWKA